MEYAAVELLTRADIMRLLAKRELHVPHVENLSLAELQGIYKGYIEPRARREPRVRPRSEQVGTAAAAAAVPATCCASRQAQKRNNEELPRDMDVMVDQQREDASVAAAAAAAEQTALADDFLRRATKRIKIDKA